MVVRLFGIVKEIGIDYVILVTKDAKELQFQIGKPWDQFVHFIHPMDELYIETNKSKLVDEDALLVIEPRYLVSVTETINAISCPRKVYVNHMGANQSFDPILQQKALKGNLLHNVFTHRVIHNSDIEEAIDQTLEKNKIDLLLADFDKSTARRYLNTDAILFRGFSITGESELDLRHYGYGLAGKLDALTDSNVIIELKSSNIPDVYAYPDHNIQMGIYQQIVADHIGGAPNGKILYVSNGATSLKDPTPWPIVKTIVGRNYAYLVMSGKYEPQLLRGEQMKTCRSCYRKEGCYKLCAGIEQQRDCEVCTLSATCDKEVWSVEKQTFYKIQTSALVYEELEVKKEEYFGHRASFLSDIDSTKLIGSKLKEYTDPHGQFITEVSIEDTDNNFRAGDFITLFPPEIPQLVEVTYQGIIISIAGSTMLISTSNRIPDQVEILHSSTSTLLRRNRDTIFRTVNSSASLIQDIIRYVDGENFTFEQLNLTEPLPALVKPLMKYNLVQQKAIQKAIATPDFFTIQGPAGTGKTSVIIEIIHQLILQGKSVLVSAFTNMAVDNVARKLSQLNIDFIRLGNTTDDIVKPYMIDQQVEYFQEFTKDKSGKIVLSTTTTIAKNSFDDLFFDFVVIDEASQMTAAHSLMPILHGDHFVLVGDHKQLPPIVLSDQAAELGLARSLFESLVAVGSRFLMLDQQYRMSDEILALPNELFYDNHLQSATLEIAAQRLEYSSELVLESSSQTIAIELGTAANSSQSNVAELVVIVNLVSELIEQNSISKDDIAIICPYRAQVAMLRKYIPDFKIDTIDRFQGTESRIVILSTTTTMDVPLLSDPRRINVALTRAREKLIVLQTNPSQMRTDTLMRKIYRDSFRRGHLLVINKKKYDNLTSRIDEKLNFLLSPVHILPEHNRDQTRKGVMLFYGSIPLVTISLEEEELCIICYQKITTGVQCPGCGYVYHENQLIDWVDKSQKCPICKHKLILVNI